MPINYMTYKMVCGNFLEFHIARKRQYIGQCKGMQIPESRKFLLVKSGILGFGFRNPAKGNQNHANDCNPECKFH